ncbi:MAG: PD-(D/E)XK nuclease family protein, partial [Acidobacteria bacterium]|nr:PD-(D/E)XK nuclease family protein [Acidobacteriota bacterium]
MDKQARKASKGQTVELPPLSQSRQGDMACQCLYFRKHVIRGPMAESQAAARGIEVHQVLATYINHLVKTKRSTDLALFDRLVSGAGSEAGEALERFRDNHGVDPERVLATELYIALDESLNPIEGAAPVADKPGAGSTHRATYEGTLDLVLLDSVAEAEIHDWKSYYQII